jgi:hypothetical protein
MSVQDGGEQVPAHPLRPQQRLLLLARGNHRFELSLPARRRGNLLPD